MGDLNFRINALNRNEVLDRIKNDKLLDLLQEDDFKKEQNKFYANRKVEPSNQNQKFQKMFFADYQEGEIKFRPTYKFDVRS